MGYAQQICKLIASHRGRMEKGIWHPNPNTVLGWSPHMSAKSSVQAMTTEVDVCEYSGLYKVKPGASLIQPCSFQTGSRMHPHFWAWPAQPLTDVPSDVYTLSAIPHGILATLPFLPAVGNVLMCFTPAFSLLRIFSVHLCLFIIK